MAGQGDIRAGRAFVEVFTDDSQLQQGLLAINKRMDAWSQQLSGMGMQAMLAAGAFSVPFVAGIKIFSDFGDQIEKMAYRTGMTTEFLSELAHAAGLSGTDIKVVETAIRGMQKTLSGAADELGSAEQKLAKLGLTLGDFQGKNPEAQLMLLIERLAEVEDESIRGAIALQIFGRAGTQLLPMALGGAEEMRAMREEAHKLGVTFSQEDAASAALLNDDLGRLMTSFKGISLAIGSAVAPAVRTVTQFFTDNVAQVSSWLREHKALVVVASLAVVALGGVGASLLTLGGIMKVASIGVYGLAVAFGLLRTSVVAPIRMLTALTTTSVFLGAQLVRTVGSIFTAARGLGIFSQMATAAGASAGVLANILATGLFNTAVALPGIFSRMQGVINKTLTNMISLLGKLAGANTLQQGFNGLLLIFSALPSLVKNQVGKAVTLMKSGFLAGIATIRSGWTSVVSTAQAAWSQTVAITKSSVLAIAVGAKTGFLAVVSSIKSVIVAARGLTAMAVIQKTWNATIFITQSLLRGLRAGLMAVTSINVASLLSQGIAAAAFQLSALATTSIPAVVSALVGMSTYALPIIIAIGAAVAAGVAIWQYFGDSIKAAFLTAMESAKWFLGWIGGGLQTMYGDFSKYMGMMGDMLANGDLAGAATTLWKFIQLEWTKGCLAVSQQFGGWLDSLYATWNEWSTSFANIFAYVTYGFQIAWAETVAWFQGIWSSVSKFFIGLWNGTVTVFGAIWGGIKDYVQPVFDWIIAAWNFVIDTLIAAGELLWGAIVGVFKSVFGWIKKFTDWVGLTGGEEETQRKDELAAKRQKARDDLEKQINNNESGRKTTDDFTREREQRDRESQARIDELESDLEKSRIDFEKSANDQKNAAFGISPNERGYSDEDYAVAKSQKRLLNARFDAENAAKSSDQTQMEAAHEEIRKAKAELRQAESAKIQADLERAKRDFDEAARNYETAKQGGDEKEITSAKAILADMSRRLDQANDGYDRHQNDGEQTIRNEQTFEIDFDLAKARKKLSDLTITLADAKNRGDTKTVEKTTREIETVKQEVSKAEYAKIMNELQNATHAFDEASKKYEAAKNTGDTESITAAQEVLEKAAKQLEDANSGYASFMNQADKGNKDVEQKVSTAGTFNAFAIRGLEGGSTMDRVAKATEETAKNTKQILKNNKQSTALSFG